MEKKTQTLEQLENATLNLIARRYEYADNYEQHLLDIIKTSNTISEVYEQVNDFIEDDIEHDQDYHAELYTLLTDATRYANLIEWL